jgi:hypothetical protein
MTERMIECTWLPDPSEPDEDERALEEREDLWIERHSVNCYYCNSLVDARLCLPADDYNNQDGGDICPSCQKTHTK